MPPKCKKGDNVRGKGPKQASKQLLPRSGKVEHRPGRDLHMSEAVVVGSRPATGSLSSTRAMYDASLSLT
eukprot:1140829-Pelagomonas_calceolata.AAC.2